MGKPNVDNLIPTNMRSKEEVRKNSAKGGVISGEVRRQKRDIKLAMDALLEKMYSGKNGEQLSGAQAIALKQMEKALKGDSKAFELVRDTAGQKPIEKVMVAEVNQDVINEIERTIMDDT